MTGTSDSCSAPNGRGSLGAEQAPTWAIRLPLVKPLSLNDRKHWRVKARETSELRGGARLMIRQARIPQHERIAVGLVYYPPDRRRRDADNLVATLKVAADACVDEGLCADDTPQFMVKSMPEIAEPDGDPRLVLIVRGLA